MKVYGEVDIEFQTFVRYALFGSALSASRLGRFTSGENSFDTY